MINEKVQKIESEIAKLKTKISESTTRIRELERQKTEIENNEIVALVRNVDISPDKLIEFIQAYIDQKGKGDVDETI